MPSISNRTIAKIIRIVFSKMFSRKGAKLAKVMGCIYIPENIKNFAASAGLARDSFVISLVVCIILSVCGVFAADTIKTGNSKPEMDIAKAVIVVGKEAEAPEVFAAEELSKYVEKMSGIKLPIAKDNEAVTNENAILIGTLKSNDKIQEIVRNGAIKTDKLDKDQDGFIIKTVGNKMVLMGSNPRSALYSVYAFLERFGCLWPAPGEDYVPALRHGNFDMGRAGQPVPPLSSVGQGCPTLPEKQLPPNFLCVQNTDVTENADLDYRMCYGFGIESVEWVDWLAKNRINWIVFWNGSNPSWDSWKKNNIAPELVKRGIAIDFGVDNTVICFLPPSKYYQEHPEYYALMNGKRIKHQVCVSNPDVIRIEAENIIEFLKKNPEVGMIDLCPSDGPLDWCECEKCMELDSPPVKSTYSKSHYIKSNSYIIFANEVSRGVNNAFPDMKILTSCYVEYMDPPRVKLQDVNKNLFSTMWFYVRCSSHAICDQDCARNQPFHSIIEEWAKWYGDKKRVIAGDLNCGMVAQCDLPLAMLNTTSKDFPYYKNFGGTVIWDYCDYYKRKFPYTLNSYLAMRLAWNVNESLDKILSGYFEKYYGKAAGYMRDYYMVWEDIAQQSGRHCSACDGMRLLTYVTENDVKKCEDNLALAEKASESKEITDRILKMKNYFDYVKAARTAGIKLDSLRRSVKGTNIDQTRKEKEELFGLCGKLSECEYGELLVSIILVEVTTLSVNEANTNFVFNGGFEYGRFGWVKARGRKSGVMDTNEFHGGGQCVRFDNSVTNESCRISQSVVINHPNADGTYFPRAPKPIKISGWSKTRDVNGKGRYCISVDFFYEDGTSSTAHSVAFAPGTHDWQYGEKVFNPEKPVNKAKLIVLFENYAGTAWFDDICLEEINPVK